MQRLFSIEQLSENIGLEIGQSAWFLIEQKRIDAFAACTNDNQWIHIDKKKAAEGPYGHTIVHGFLLIALIPFFNQEVYSLSSNVVMTINYGINRARFLQPVTVGSEIKDQILLKSFDRKGENRILIETTHTITIKNSDRAACLVDSLRMLVVGFE